MKDYVKGLKCCPPKSGGARPGDGAPNVPAAVTHPPTSVVGLSSSDSIPKATVTVPRSKVGA